MTGRDELQRLASFIKQRNAVEGDIAAIIGRPANSGHIGEFVASRIFDIELFESAANKGSDGHFTSGSLAGKSVNVKVSSKNEGLLNVNPDAHPDFYLVLTGPKTPPKSSRGTVQPWTIASVFLFDAYALVQRLKKRGVQIGNATSVIQELWREAEIYTSPNNRILQLTTTQVEMLELFRDP